MTSWKIKGERNPLIIFSDGTTVQNVGDVHLGRNYINGVPLDQRGKIEAKQWWEFEHLLMSSEADYLVQNGDIFDKFVVDNAIVDRAATIILEAKRKHPERRDIYLRGNHDDSKDVEMVSSFDLLVRILKEAKEPNLRVVESFCVWDKFAFCGWSPDRDAEETASPLSDYPGLKAVFGHWDVNLPDHASKFNLVPVEQIKTVTTLAVTGHDHKPGQVERDGVTILKVGSIIPLAHGEELESDELIYTITLDEYDPKVHDGKIVRFVLGEDEEVPDADFLQVKVLPKPSAKKQDVTEPETDSFDLIEVLEGFLGEQEIAENLIADVVGRFRASNAE